MIASLIATKLSFEPSDLDNKILRVLRKGRLRAVEVAKKLRISRQHASERVLKLVSNGLVRRVKAGSKIARYTMRLGSYLIFFNIFLNML